MAAAELFSSCSPWGGKRLPLRIRQDTVVFSRLLGPPGAPQGLDTFTGSVVTSWMCGRSSEGYIL